MEKRLSRSEVPVELTWDLSHIYPSDEAWEADLARLEEDAAAVAAFRGRLGEGPTVLLACLRARDALLERMRKVGAYASLHESADGTDPKYQAMNARVHALFARLGARLAFLEPELLSLPEGTLARYLEAEPELETYRNQLERIELRRPHTLSAEVEETLAALSETLSAPRTIYDRVIAADLAFPSVTDETGREVEMSVARYDRLLQSRDRDVRRRAHEALLAGLNRHKNTLAATLAAHIRENVTLARLRRYSSAEEMILKPQQIPYEVYTNVLDVIHDEIAPHVRRLVRLRQRVLGLDAVHGYDLTAPLDPDFNPSATFEEAERLITEAVAPLGEEYGEIIRAAFRDRWIDRADNAGKPHGAFCAGVYGVHSYILMTWSGKMRNVFTLAHELGHAGHGMLAARHQVISNTWSTRFFVEAPSTANELLLGHHILDTTTDPRMRRFIILQFLGTFIHNMVTHLLQGHLERRLYQMAEAGQALTLTTIMEAQGEILERFYDGTVVIDDVERLAWMTVPHYYVGLYPYTYAAGLSCACAVVDAIRREGPPAAERWLRTLKAGGTLPPLELMAMAGVDMRSPEPLRQAVAFFGQLVAELEESFTARATA
ncbi:MAG: oligoendopeptidase F [Firmicutes bacterium]|nr:oligoendopeptidase F [Bacillota bacterium]